MKNLQENQPIVNVVLPLLLAAFILIAFLKCEKAPTLSNVQPVYSTFSEIPGITAEETAAIKAFQEQNRTFTFGAVLSTEAFITENDEIGGYIALLCGWLTKLFDIPFKIEMCTLGDVFAKLSAKEIDFGVMMDSKERQNTYFLSDAIGQRWIAMLRIENSLDLNSIMLTRPLRYAFLENSIAYEMVSAVVDSNTFEAFFASDNETGYNMLKSGEVDAILIDDVKTVGFSKYADIHTFDFLPLLFNTVLMATGNPELAPVISIVNKALQNGGAYHVAELYRLGYKEYRKQRFLSLLTNEEKEYLLNNSTVPILNSYYNYPISSYNAHEDKWEGISVDILKEVENLTGLAFTVVNDTNAVITELLPMLEEGKGYLLPDFVQTMERKKRFIWPKNSFLTDQYALVSKHEFPHVDVYDISHSKIGLVRGNAHTALFRSWFPNATTNTTEYPSVDDVFYALDRGEVDLMMYSKIKLLAMTNYFELTGYKINLLFNHYYEVTFGFNKDQTILCSIVDKALSQIDTDAISEQWLSKTYDFKTRMLEAQRPWLIGSSAILALLLILLAIVYVKDQKKNKTILEHSVKSKSAEMANRTKSLFLATMSHEIRTPMNSIMGFAELAQDISFDPQVKDYLGKIVDSTKWLLSIINDILDISKIEVGKMELENAPFDLHDIFLRCQSVILPIAQEKGVDLEVYVEPPIGKRVMGDPVRLYQVLMNLLANAVKFTNAGTVVKLTSAVKNMGDGNATVYFEVKDSGIGMTSEHIGRIFDPFTQADSSTTRKYGGTGLGLAIVKNIVELMGGKLAVDSTPGIGSVFSFEVTFNTTDMSADAYSQTTDVLEKPYFDAVVLVCDDNHMNQQVVREHLARVGIQTVVADNGKIGVDMVRERTEKGEKPFDLIFMDMFMPVMDGLEAATEIITLNIGTPVVAMTANVMVSELEKYRKHGMLDCLGKPFTSQELWHVLLKYLTPVSAPAIRSEDDIGDDLQKALQISFVKNNQRVHTEINEAVASGDIKLAHRLAHTLKGSAGLIGKIVLQDAASEVEYWLKGNTGSIPVNKMKRLETELLSVLEELKSSLGESAAQKSEILNAEDILAVLEKMEDMLENINPEVAGLLDDIRAVPGAEKLAYYIENYDFEPAMQMLVELKKRVRT